MTPGNFQQINPDKNKNSNEANPNKWHNMSPKEIGAMNIAEITDMMRFLTESVIGSVEASFDMNRVVIRVDELINLTRAKKLNMGNLGESEKQKLQNLATLLIGLGCLGMNSEINKSFYYGKDDNKALENIQVSSVGVYNNQALNLYRTALIKESNSKGLSTSYIRCADIASFGKLRHFGMEYGDSKKQELTLRKLQVIEEKKEEIVQKVLQKYPQHNLLSKYFEISLFNDSNSDEYFLIVAFRGQITDQNETMIAQINKEISGEISHALIQNLITFPINSFTSPVPLEDDTNFARSPLLIRIEEEFCNCPYTIYELEKNHFPRISSFLALKSLNFKTIFLKEARAIWLSLSSENQVFNHKDFDIGAINYIQENFDIGIDSLKPKSEFVEQKK